MSSGRSFIVSRCENDREFSELVIKLQALLPERNRRNLKRVPTSKVLKEVCNYIRKLNKEVENLSDTLSELLASSSGYNNPTTVVDADVLITNLLQH